jgi:hypothetical protein
MLSLVSLHRISTSPCYKDSSVKGALRIPKAALKKIAAMRWSKTSYLIIFVIAICAAMEITRNLRIAGYVTLHTQLVAAYFAFGLNFMAAIVGLWTRFRLAWLSYLVLSVASILFLSSTPLAAAWILIKLTARHAFA